MKNKTAFILLCTITLTCLWGGNLFGQSTSGEVDINNKSFLTAKEPFVNKLSVSPNIGLLHSFCDFENPGNNFGYGLTLNYDFLKVLRLSAGVLGGKLSGSNENINTLNAVNATQDLGYGILFKTNILELTFPKIDLNVTKLIFKDRSEFFNAFSVHAFISHGLIFFDSKTYAMQDESVHLLYGKHRGQSGKTTEAVTSYGVDLSYRLKDRLDITIGTSLKNVWNDRLDAWESPGSANDKFSYTSIGVTYYFKKGKKKNKKTSKVEESLPPTAVEEVTDSLKPTLIVSDEVEKEEEEIIQEEKVEEKAKVIPEEKAEEVTEETVVTEVVAEEIIKQDTVTPMPTGIIYNGKGNFIIVAAFQTLRRAKISAEEQKEKGQVATIVKNRSKTLYLVSIGRFDNREEALTKMREVRKEGIYKDAWVFYNDIEQ